MDGLSVYCSVCFSMPGEPCVEKYLAHGTEGVTPIHCAPHSARLIDDNRAQFFLSQKAPR